MKDLIRRMEFRAFLFDSDPEFVVDMYRCLEVLEGSWFDQEETCRMHHKMVVRANGSSWVASIGRAIIGYADLIENSPGNGWVYRWRLHPNFRHPQIVKVMIDGLKERARKRCWTSLTFFADAMEIVQDLESIGLKRDRRYQWVNVSEFDDAGSVVSEPLPSTMPEILQESLVPFIGSPLPPKFALARSFMASEYGVFNFQRPHLFRLKAGELRYTACFDGREWLVFRERKEAADAENLKPILGAIASLHEGRILLSQAAIEKGELVPASEEQLWDVFLSKV